MNKNAVLKQTLFEKLVQEFNAYKQKLLAMSPEEILEVAHSYHVRESILDALIYDETLTENQMLSLMASDTPLQDICNEWTEFDGEAEYMAVIRKCITDCAGRKDKTEV